ncbi:hypothetical protein [Acidisphaera rubrifaciens]|uniref:Uncharacterized protein n=1 Tax=Acidisphaera rubrifaciens HS-AP3 TaxID=1231350 RepID=A0A0D6P7G3_9PROT|nr:hypothetical protein [Acidisphaera rubrifaciens]GAN76814.1 hypothetical protein Asru_0165_22 [Acidisphaera rubrifaciens HS-AP3]
MTRTTIIAAAILALSAGSALAQSAGPFEAAGSWHGIDGNRASIWVPAVAPQTAHGVVVAPSPGQYAANASSGIAIR